MELNNLGYFFMCGNTWRKRIKCIAWLQQAVHGPFTTWTALTLWCYCTAELRSTSLLANGYKPDWTASCLLANTEEHVCSSSPSPSQPPLASILRIISISIFQRFWCWGPEGSSGTCNSPKSVTPAWNDVLLWLLTLGFGLASSKLSFEECRFLISYQSGEVAHSGATSAASQPSLPKACGW